MKKRRVLHVDEVRLKVSDLRGHPSLCEDAAEVPRYFESVLAHHALWQSIGVSEDAKINIVPLGKRGRQVEGVVPDPAPSRWKGGNPQYLHPFAPLMA